jgi:hypothetical protein
MATSGAVTNVTFNTQTVLDDAFRIAGILAEKVTPEMLNYGKRSLQLLLSSMSNRNVPSWCIEKVILPMYEGDPVVPMPAGTVAPLNVNYRTVSAVQAVEDPAPATEIIYEAQNISTAGIRWNAASVVVTCSVGPGSTGPWETVGTFDSAKAAGEWEWIDTLIPDPANTYFRLSAATNIDARIIYLGNNPQNIPMGVLNRDQYTYQSNQVFPGQPTTYWFQRNYPVTQLNIWPAPNEAAGFAQLVVWRHRNIMDVGEYRENIEMSQQWFEAITMALGYRVALKTPGVPMDRIQWLKAESTEAMNAAWDGDGDGAPTQMSADMTPYTA